MVIGLRSGILGTGFMARVHANAVLANGGIVAGITGSSVESARQFSERLPGAVAAANLEELLDLDLDVIHVCTPNSVHFEQAMLAIGADVAVICEKQLATTPADAADLVRMSEGQSRITAVPFVYRYYPMVREARTRILNASDNRIWLAHGSYLQDWLADPSASNWRVQPARGGTSRAFGDIGVHWCDLFEFATGQRIVRLNAVLSNAFERDGGSAQNLTEDGGVVQFLTDSGAVGSVVISQATAGRANRLWFSFDGPLESYTFDQEAPETLWVGGSKSNSIILRNPSVQSAPASRPSALPAGHPQGYQTCFNDFVADVYEAARAEASDLMPTFRDGLRAALITAAVIESAARLSWVDVLTVDQYLTRPAELASA